MVYGGTIQPGKGCGGDTLDIVSAFQAYGEYVSGAINEERRYDIIRHACPGPGACGGSKFPAPPLSNLTFDILTISFLDSVHC